jgi:hypothetical protein
MSIVDEIDTNIRMIGKETDKVLRENKQMRKALATKDAEIVELTEAFEAECEHLRLQLGRLKAAVTADIMGQVFAKLGVE